MPTNNVTSFINNHNVDQNFGASWTADGFERLRTYLGSVKAGQPRVYTAPFAKGQSMAKVLEDWKKVLVSVKTRWPSLWDYEIDQAGKVGPMSVQLPLEERLDDIRHYYEDILLSSTPISESAMKAVVSEFAKVSVRVRPQKETLDKMKKSTNSGNPWFTKKRNVVQDIIPCEIEHTNNEIFSRIQGDLWNLTAVIGWRGQEGGPSDEDTKQRVVWMFPFALNLCELQVYQPLIESAQARNVVPAWVSMESVDREVTMLFDTKPSGDLIVCTDFSKFDQHFNEHLQQSAKTILAELLTKSKEANEWLDWVFPAKYLIRLAWETDGADVSYLTGRHGMASGSGGTNVDETLAHRSLQYEVAIQHHARLNPHSMCLGDDGILTYPGITVDDVVAAYTAHGQECNKEKQYAATQDCVYLRRWHHAGYRDNGVCVGVYPTTRALGRLRYLERFMDPEYWSPELVALRQLSIIENCKWHPLFHQFIEFCMRRDKYRLGIDIPGFFDNLLQKAREATSYMQDFLGYTKTLQGEGPEGITNWEVVKYLKSKR